MFPKTNTIEIIPFLRHFVQMTERNNRQILEILFKETSGLFLRPHVKLAKISPHVLNQLTRRNLFDALIAFTADTKTTFNTGQPHNLCATGQVIN